MNNQRPIVRLQLENIASIFTSQIHAHFSDIDKQLKDLVDKEINEFIAKRLEETIKQEVNSQIKNMVHQAIKFKIEANMDRIYEEINRFKIELK